MIMNVPYSKMVTQTTGLWHMHDVWYNKKIKMNLYWNIEAASSLKGDNKINKFLMFDLHGIQDGDPNNRIPCKSE